MLVFSKIGCLCGATVARLTPDQKVACSNHVRVKIFCEQKEMSLVSPSHPLHMYPKHETPIRRFILGTVGLRLHGVTATTSTVEGSTHHRLTLCRNSSDSASWYKGFLFQLRHKHSFRASKVHRVSSKTSVLQTVRLRKFLHANSKVICF